MAYPRKVLHWINDAEVKASSNSVFKKINPATGAVLAEVARGNTADVEKAVAAGKAALPAWSRTLVVRRGEILRNAVLLMMQKKAEIAEITARESGKAAALALGEASAAIECGFFFAGEGRRYFGEVLTSAEAHREVTMVRQASGLGVLLTPFNNPAPGVAWKLFPALLCGNSVIIKSHEDVPYVAVWFAKILKEAGLPKGVLSVVQGTGSEAGEPLTRHPDVAFISLTGSPATGKKVLHAAADRLAKVSIESGGKNPFIVCDDADLDRAATLASASAFIDAGQRCAAASRIIVMEAVYEEFKQKLLERVKALKVGDQEGDNYGAIINEKRMRAILDSIETAKTRGARVVCGGERLTDESHKNGFFISPAVLEEVDPDDEISQKEIFGPVTILYRVKTFDEAVALANNSPFRLSSALHTKSIHRAQEFKEQYRGGVVRINGATHGSEPHMPFGGLGLSGNGWREPGTKALDFYSEWKQISTDHDPLKI
ncbi:MAG: aldehyde dehydrogenase [Candidatus Sungbacteria bacterium]|uniref:Aldehyde dehydrogenase n=1 Tax=Candidatus Sungiibacteriota bacterium TaxID=2750080 RepID=A0A9D6LMT8_9BACT|nr:aldehyde dehydrogenase [Candidatus Sungbacteria bacterium]